MGQFSVEICPPVGQFTVKLNSEVADRDLARFGLATSLLSFTVN